MPASTTHARPVRASVFPPLDNCPTEATQELAQAIVRAGEGLNNLATAVAASTAQRKDVDGFFSDLRGGVAFLAKHRLKIAASVPAVLVAIGAVSPNAAKFLGSVLQAVGAQ